jgi:hypothetical protein
MENTSSTPRKEWRHIVLFSLAVLILLGAIFGLALPCGGGSLSSENVSLVAKNCCKPLARVNLQATPSGHLVMQATQTLTDTAGHSWQITVYKYPHPAIDPQPLMLGLKQVDPVSTMEQDQSMTVLLQDSQPISLPAQPRKSSIDWAAENFDACYDLSSVWSSLAGADTLTLRLSIGAAQTADIPVAAETLQEWHTVASCEALLCGSGPVALHLTELAAAR